MTYHKIPGGRSKGKTPKDAYNDQVHVTSGDEQASSFTTSINEHNRHNVPCYELRQVYSDRTQRARLCSLTELLQSASKVHLNRRAFLGVSSISMLATLAACSTEVGTDELVVATGVSEPIADPAEAVEEVVLNMDDMDCGQIRAHVDAVTSLRFSPDARLLVSTSIDNSLKLWDLESRDPPTILDEQQEPLAEANFIQGGSKLYWLRPSPQTLNGYDLQAHKSLEPLEGLGGLAWNASFNADETRLAIAGSVIEVVDFPARKLLWSINPNTMIIIMVYSPLDNSLYTGDIDGFIRQWDLESGDLLNEFLSESGLVLGLSISADGRWLAWGGADDNFIHLWDLVAGEEIDRWNTPGVSVSASTFSPDGRWLAASGNLNAIIVIDLDSLHQRYMLEAPGNEVSALRFSPDSQLLAAGTDIGTIVFWETDSFEQVNDTPDDCLFDKDAAPLEDEFNTVRVTDDEGISRTYTLPCGAPIPTGAICTCDCVPGTFAGWLPSIGDPRLPSSGSGSSGGSSGGACSCDEVCTCVPVCICMAV